MKTIKIIFLLTVMISGWTTVVAGNYPTEGTQDEKKASVNVYYFHTNARCVTCRTIEAEAKQDVKELFGEKVCFMSYNLDDKEGEAKGKELGINSQMLVIVKDNRKIDITNQGFLYARTNPDKFKQVLEEKITPLL